MKFISICYVLLTLTVVHSLCQAAEPPCAAKTKERAKKLLIFHAGTDDRMTIDDKVKQIPSLQNPADPKQKFDVFEIWGYIYKAQFRMRFIYYNSPVTSCLLMGEEILEYDRP